MYEVEFKIRAPHAEVKAALEDADAHHVETVVQEDTYYDAPDRNFAETDEALRVRTEETADERRVLLTYKGPLVGETSKTRAEAETPVGDADALRSILDGLGYDPAATVQKERTRYVLDDCLVTLDTVAGLGEFVEVEYAAGEGTVDTDSDTGGEADIETGGKASVETEADIDAAREQATRVLESLGLSVDEQIRTSYLELVLAEEQ